MDFFAGYSQEQMLLIDTLRLTAREEGVAGRGGGFDKLQETVAGIRKLNVASSLQATFLENVAEYFDEAGENAV